MTICVAYDGRGPISKTALLRARNISKESEADLRVISVVPRDPEYALEKHWIGDISEFNPKKILGTLHRQAVDIAPEGSFEGAIIETADTEAIAQTIHDSAIDAEAVVLVVASDNIGAVVQEFQSGSETVGTTLGGSPDYDLLVVRSRTKPDAEIEGVYPSTP